MLYVQGASLFVGGILFLLAGRMIIKRNRAEKSRLLIYGCLAFTWIMISILVGSDMLEKHQAALHKANLQHAGKSVSDTAEEQQTPSQAKTTEESKVTKKTPVKPEEEKAPYSKSVSHVISPETERAYQKLAERVHEIQEFINNGTVLQESDSHIAK